MVTKETELDIYNVCRICLQDSGTHMVSIYEQDEKECCVSLCEKIESCTGVKIIRSSELPTRICLNCRAYLTLAHKFRQICRHSDTFLRECIYKEFKEEEDKPLPEPVEPTQTFEQLEVEVLDEPIWCSEEPIEESLVPIQETPNVFVVPVVGEVVEAPVPGSNPHVCSICGNSYSRKSTLDTHMRRHNNERPYQCEICQKSFHVNYQLMRHIRQHTGARPYSCEYCKRSFADRTALVKHERIHRNERPYACNTCGKTFTYASVLKVHYKTHTGEKPHVCRLCKRTFARNHNLVAHLQTQQHVNDPRCAAYLQCLKTANINIK